MSNPPKTPPTREQKLKAAALAAVAVVCKKDGNRDHLSALEKYRVEGRFAGEVDGLTVSFPVRGELAIGADGTTSSTVNPNAAQLLALALALVPKTKRDKFLAELPRQVSRKTKTKEKGELPKADEGLQQQAEGLLVSLRSRKSSPKKGAVTFDRDA